MKMLMQFRKTEQVRHLGLLDLQRTMQRALRRSGLPISYSQGFNPHINMSFASALSSGIPGDAELLEVSLTKDVSEEECLHAMNAVLPPSLAVSRVRLVDDHFPKSCNSMEQSEYQIVLYGESGHMMERAIPNFLSESEIMALRKTKKFETMVNIRTMIHELKVLESTEEAVILRARTSFKESATLKPGLLLETLATYAKTELPRHSIRRTRLIGLENGEPVALIDLGMKNE